MGHWATRTPIKAPPRARRVHSPLRHVDVQVRRLVFAHFDRNSYRFFDWWDAFRDRLLVLVVGVLAATCRAEKSGASVDNLAKAVRQSPWTGSTDIWSQFSALIQVRWTEGFETTQRWFIVFRVRSSLSFSISCTEQLGSMTSVFSQPGISQFLGESLSSFNFLSICFKLR